MKILTNVQTTNIGGIAQTFSSFVNFLETNKKKRIQITGVEIRKKANVYQSQVYEHNSKSSAYKNTENLFSLISSFSDIPNIGDVAKSSEKLIDIENSYRELIAKYEDIIRKEKPDLILINGTYYIPWCLLKASKAFNIPVVLHYHGILSKEVAHWDEKPRLLLEAMEKSFDNKNFFYIFPSNLAKEVVENEVYKHKIKNYSVLPNSVPKHFFEVTKKGNSKNIGIIGRWTKIKNPTFTKKMANYNHKHGDKFSINVITDLTKGTKFYDRMSELVKFKTPVENYKLANFYGQMGVVVCPSVFETYGNVPQEALAANTPALVSSQMGVAETFKKIGLNDWIIDFNSVKNVYLKAEELSRQEVGPVIRKRIYDGFSSARINQEYLDILKSV